MIDKRTNIVAVLLVFILFVTLFGAVGFILYLFSLPPVCYTLVSLAAVAVLITVWNNRFEW